MKLQVFEVSSLRNKGKKVMLLAFCGHTSHFCRKNIKTNNLCLFFFTFQFTLLCLVTKNLYLLKFILQNGDS